MRQTAEIGRDLAQAEPTGQRLVSVIPERRLAFSQSRVTDIPLEGLKMLS